MATLGTAHEQYCTLYNTIRLLKYISYIVQSKLAIHSKKNCNALHFHLHTYIYRFSKMHTTNISLELF